MRDIFMLCFRPACFRRVLAPGYCGQDAEIVGGEQGPVMKRHCERSEAIHSFILPLYGLLRCARNDGRHSFAISPLVFARGFVSFVPLSRKRAQGMPGARCTRSLESKKG
jgi:hypothetical protein